MSPTCEFTVCHDRLDTTRWMDGWMDMALCWAAAAAAPAHQLQNMNNIDKTIIRGWLVGDRNNAKFEIIAI